MTAIVKHEKKPEPPQTWAGLFWPGLGHLLTGQFLHGIGLMSVTAVVLAALFAGLPSIAGLISTPSGIGWHALLGFLSFCGLLPLLWWRAYRRAMPREQSEVEYNSNRAAFMRQLLRHRTGMLGFYGITILLLITLFTPLLSPFDPDMIDAGPATAAPGWSIPPKSMNTPPTGWFNPSVGEGAEGHRLHLMGTDERGRDVYARLLFGARISLMIGFLAVSIAASIGTTVGATAGFLGGWTDRGLMWWVDLLLAMPRLILLLAVVGIIDAGGVWRLLLIVAILGLTGWMGVARIVRSQVLSLKEQDFIQAARALGYSQSRIVFQHLIPNAIAPVIVFCSLAIGGTMLAEAGLSFLGLGVQPPTSTWGVMVNEGRSPLRHAPWISMFPGLAIVVSVMSFNLLGDGLRDALDPKQR